MINIMFYKMVWQKECPADNDNMFCLTTLKSNCHGLQSGPDLLPAAFDWNDGRKNPSKQSPLYNIICVYRAN